VRSTHNVYPVSSVGIPLWLVEVKARRSALQTWWVVWVSHRQPSPPLPVMVTPVSPLGAGAPAVKQQERGALPPLQTKNS